MDGLLLMGCIIRCYIKQQKTNDVLVVYPSAKPNWNSGFGNDLNWPTPDINDIGFISSLIDTLSNRYNVDLNRIYAAGFSNGGFMAYNLACQLSDRITAVASVAGVMSTETAVNCNPSRPIPVLHIHGTDDTIVRLDSTSFRLSVDETVSIGLNLITARRLTPSLCRMQIRMMEAPLISTAMQTVTTV